MQNKIKILGAISQQPPPAFQLHVSSVWSPTCHLFPSQVTDTPYALLLITTGTLST